MKYLLITVLVAAVFALPTAAQTDTPTPTPTLTPTNTPTPRPTARSNPVCGYGLPCGPIPWNLPRFPSLESPTPIPTLFITATPTPTYTPSLTPTWTPVLSPTITPTPSSTYTPTPTYTPTLALDADFLNDQLATVQAMFDATPIEFVDAAGTPVNTDTTFSELGTNAGMFFGYVRGAASNGNFGKITPLFAFVILTLTVVFLVKLSLYLLPVIAAIFGLIRKILNLILDFLPG